MDARHGADGKVERTPERDVPYETLSGIPVQSLYTPEDLEGWRYEDKLGYPGEFPYTRGPYPSMYRGRLWTMRMFAGFGRPEDTNARFKYLLEQGQTGRRRQGHPGADHERRTCSDLHPSDCCRGLRAHWHGRQREDE